MNPPSPPTTPPRLQAPPTALAVGDDVLAFLADAERDDHPRRSARRRIAQESELPTLVAIGSRAWSAVLAKEDPSVDPASIPRPTYFQQEDKDAAPQSIPPRFNSPDFDFIVTPERLSQLLTGWKGHDRLALAYATSPVKVVDVIRTENGVDLYACDFELRRPKSVWKASAEALKRCPDSSSIVIAQSAMESGITTDASVLGIPDPVPCPSLAVQFAIKRAHIFYPIQWRKHIEWIHFALAKFPKRLKWDIAEMHQDPLALEVFLGRKEELAGLKGIPGAHINLNMRNEEFFADESGGMIVKRQFNHDAIHERIAFPGRPLYERFKYDQTKARLERSLFEAAPMATQLRLVREEVMAIAIERYLLPGRIPRTELQEAYWLALERVSTTLAKGWFRTFAASHYPQLKQCDEKEIASVLEYIDANPTEFQFVDTSKAATAAVAGESEEGEFDASPLGGSIDMLCREPRNIPDIACAVIGKMLVASKKARAKNTYRIRVDPKGPGRGFHDTRLRHHFCSRHSFRDRYCAR